MKKATYLTAVLLLLTIVASPAWSARTLGTHDFIGDTDSKKISITADTPVLAHGDGSGDTYFWHRTASGKLRLSVTDDLGYVSDTDIFSWDVEDGFPFKNYLDPDGLVLTDADSPQKGFDLTGGDVYVSNPGSDTNAAVINIPDDGDTAFDITTTGAGGLINSSTVASDTWYQCGVIDSSTNTNPPAVACWNHSSGNDSTPQNANELPSGYDQLRAMGTPGKTWWVKTDGSSNIQSFSHVSSGWMAWDDAAQSNFSQLLTQTSSFSTDNTLDVSAQAPPTSLTLTLNTVMLETDSNGANEMGTNHEAMTDTEHGQHQNRALASSRVTNQATLLNITGQTVHWRLRSTTNINQVTIDRVSQFKAVN